MTQIPPPPPPRQSAPPISTPGIATGGPGLAIAALVLGLVSAIPFLGVLTGLAGLVLGIIALATRRRGKGMAAAGVVLSILLPAAVHTAILIPAISKAKTAARQTICQTNLHAIGRGVAIYMMDFNDAMPANLSVLVDHRLVSGPEVFQCPEAGSTGYFYTPLADPLAVRFPGDAIIACDRTPIHQGKRCVLYLDGHTQALEESDFQAELAQPHNAEFAKALQASEGP